MIQIPYLDILSVLLSGQEPRTSNLSHLFSNLEDPVLVQTLSYKRKITYHPLIIGFFNAGYWAYVAFTCQCSPTNTFYLSNAPVNYLLPMTKMLSWTSSFHLALIYEQNISRLAPWVEKEGREAWHTIFITYIINNRLLKTQSYSKLCSDWHWHVIKHSYKCSCLLVYINIPLIATIIFNMKLTNVIFP